MKRLLLLLIISLAFIQNPRAQEIESYVKTDSMMIRYDSLGYYKTAIFHAKTGLSKARKFKNTDKESYYHLRLAKFYYYMENIKSSIMHFRLYSILREQEASNLKNKEIFLLENAYLEQLNIFSNEIDLNDRLITVLQKENAIFEQNLNWVYTSAKIAGAAIIIILAIFLYDLRMKKKSGKVHSENEINELERLRSLTVKQTEEQERKQEEVKLLKGNQQRQAWYTRQIQMSLLPNPKNNEQPKNSFILKYSKSSINGDFYVKHEIDNKTVIAVLDCPGHGPDAVFNTVIAHHHIQEILTSGVTKPSMVLTMMDQKIKQSLEETGLDKNEIHGSKIAVCEINNKTKEVEYAGAGFPLFYVHLDDVHLERGSPFPVGDVVLSDSYYSSSHIRLSYDDMIYFITDGYYRQLGGKQDKKFMRRSVTSLLKSMHHQSLTEQKLILDKVLKEWQGKNPLTDDVLVVGIRM